MDDIKYLYINSRGFPVSIHSYSAGELYRFCARKYKLQKLDGWEDRETAEKAALPFGNCLEAAVRAYHESNLNPERAIDVFSEGWKAYKDFPLIYGRNEISWDNLMEMGRKMVEKYDAVFPSLPIKNKPLPQFQTQVSYFVYGIEVRSHLDMIVHRKDSEKRTMIVDIKTTSSKIYLSKSEDRDDSREVALDSQLKIYSLVTGIPRVALLCFVKKESPDIQFLETTVSEKHWKEADEQLRGDIINIHNSYKYDLWPMQGGIRYPNNKCLGCSHRGICLSDSELMNKLLIRKDDF